VGIALQWDMLMAVANSPSHAAMSASTVRNASESAALERRAQDGDRSALTQLLKTHAPVMLGVCQQIVGHGDARDALQEAMEKVVRQLAHFDSAQGSFRSWACAVARNVCRDRLRRRGLERAAFASDGDERTQVASGSGPDPERQAIASEGTSVLARALSELPEEMRTALVMFHVHEASYEEIARALEVPLGTIMTWLHRGRHRLRAAVEDA
jgi:RNA polymerase sigma-70 factor (ECF subfamily)